MDEDLIDFDDSTSNEEESSEITTELIMNYKNDKCFDNLFQIGFSNDFRLYQGFN